MNLYEHGDVSPADLPHLIQLPRGGLSVNSVLMLPSALPVISVSEAQEVKDELCVFLPKSDS